MAAEENKQSGNEQDTVVCDEQITWHKNLLWGAVLLFFLPAMFLLLSLAWPAISRAETIAYVLLAWTAVGWLLLARGRWQARHERAQWEDRLASEQRALDADIMDSRLQEAEFLTMTRQGGAELADLRETALYHKSLLEDVRDGIISMDETGKIQSFNPAASDIFGYSPQEVVGRNVSMLMPEEVGKQHDFHLLRYLKTGEKRVIGKTLEVMAQRRGGQVFPIEIAVRELQLPSDRIFTAMIRDISDKRLRESTLRNSESHLDVILEAAPDAILTLDETGHVLSANSHTERLLGYRREELLGQGLDYFVPSPYTSMTLELFRHHHILGGPGNIVSGRQIRVTDRDGLVFPVELSLSWFQAGDQAVFIAILRDISARVRHETELAKRGGELFRANVELEQFVHFTTHELREPLREVLNYARLLTSPGDNTQPVDPDKMLARAVVCLETSSLRISRLLDYDRVRTGVLHCETVDSNDAVRTAVRDLALEFKESEALIAFEDLPMVHADFGQLALLFQNLFSNAIKFRSDEGPRIRISAEREGEQWVFCVSDNGIGIGAESHDEIFLIFRRLHDHDSFPGSGIGLAICEKIVQGHGGRIWAQSEVGKGTSIFCTLPAVATADLSESLTFVGETAVAAPTQGTV